MRNFRYFRIIEEEREETDSIRFLPSAQYREVRMSPNFVRRTSAGLRKTHHNLPSITVAMVICEIIL